jgi:transposase
MKPYSLDLRQRVINAVKHDHFTPEGAATRFKVSRATAYNYLQLDRDLNDLSALKSPGANRKITREQEPLLYAQILEQPDHTLEQHCQIWTKKTGESISVACMHNSIQRLGITLKKNDSRQRTKRTSTR